MKNEIGMIDTKALTISEEDRIIRFTGSTSVKDRDGEILEAKGWNVKNFLKNPVFLLAHDYRSLPIGRAVSVDGSDKGLAFDIQFADRETYPLADTVYRLYKGGFMNAVSVGFQTNREKIDVIDGVPHHKDMELLELSAVSVPANPEALMVRMFDAKGKGIVSEQEIMELTLAAKSFFAGWKIADTHLKPEPDVTENYIRLRQKDPALFIDATFRTIDISVDEKIKAVVGKLKADGVDGPMVVQSYLFDKDSWTTARAEEWVAAHKRSVEIAGTKSVRVLSKENETLLRDAVKAVEVAAGTIAKVLDKLNLPTEGDPKGNQPPNSSAVYGPKFLKRVETGSAKAELLDSKLVDGIKGLHEEVKNHG